MAIDLNADVGQIFKDLLGGGKGKKSAKSGANKKSSADERSIGGYKNAVLKTILIICLTAIVIWFINDKSMNPMQKEDSEFATNEQLQEALQTLKNNKKSAEKLLAKNTERATEILPEFSQIGDSKSLFNLITTLAESNNLVISDISQGKLMELKKPIQYFKNTVTLEIEGYYRNFVDFKRQLHAKKPILTVESEVISLKNTQYGDRKLKIQINLSDYSLETENYEKMLRENS